MEPILETAAQLLTPIWRGIPADYKSRYALSIWRQFEDQVKVAAYSTTLSQWFTGLCAKLQVSFPPGPDLDRVAEILKTADERAMLRVLREETSTVVLLVRVENEERRAAWQAKQGRER